MRRRIFGLYKASDSSIWADIGETALGRCEVCGLRPSFIYECISGKWYGARVVACSMLHARDAIEDFIRGVIRVEGEKV